jgi:hypothetical protein
LRSIGASVRRKRKVLKKNSALLLETVGDQQLRGDSRERRCPGEPVRGTGSPGAVGARGQ